MEIVTKAGFNVVGKRVSCRWEQLSVEMPAAWQEVLSRKNQIKQRVSSNILDVCLHVIDKEFTQLVGVEVADLSNIPNGFEGVHIPEQQYVYTNYTGSVYGIADQFGEMLNWANANRHTIDPADFKIQFTPEESKEEGFKLYYKLI